MAEVEVDEVLRLCGDCEHGLWFEKGRSMLTMSDEASKVPANNAVPGSALPRVELEGLLAMAWEGRRAGGGRTSFLMYCAMS